MKRGAGWGWGGGRRALKSGRERRPGFSMNWRNFNASGMGIRESGK